MTIKQRGQHHNVSRQQRFKVSNEQKEKIHDAAQKQVLQMSDVRRELQRKLRRAVARRKWGLRTEDNRKPCDEGRQRKRVGEQKMHSNEHGHLNKLKRNIADGGTDHLLILAQSAELLLELEDKSHGSSKNNDNHEGSQNPLNSFNSTDQILVDKKYDVTQVDASVEAGKSMLLLRGRTRLSQFRRSARLKNAQKVQEMHEKPIYRSLDCQSNGERTGNYSHQVHKELDCQPADMDPNQSPQKKVRGKTLCDDLHKNIPKHPLPLVFNDRGQPVGGETVQFISYLGVLSRDGSLLPIDCPSWDVVDPMDKEKVWDAAKVRFDIPESDKVRIWFMQSVGRKWKEHQCDLKRRYFTNPPKGVDPSYLNPPGVEGRQWLNLVGRDGHWQSSKTKKMVEINKVNREKKMMHHTTGQKSFPLIIASENLDDGVEPSRSNKFKITYTRKEKIKRQQEKQQEGARDPPGGEDVLSQGFGEDRPGQCHTLGVGPTPSQEWVGKSNSQMSKHGEMACLRSKLAEFEEREKERIRELQERDAERDRKMEEALRKHDERIEELKRMFLASQR